MRYHKRPIAFRVRQFLATLVPDRAIVADAVGLCGFIAIVVGASHMSAALAWTVGGVLACVVAVLLQITNKPP